MKKILLIIAMNFIFTESDLLRSKYLTDDMITNIEKLDNYNKTARRIFNKYERAQFYQMVAYTYSLKYEGLVKELESLDRHYYSLFNHYIENIDYSSIEKKVKTPGIQNEFIPILFEERSAINIRLFKAQAKMFKKQYHDYLDYFNHKINLYNNKLIELQQSNILDKKQAKNYNKIYDDYNSFLLEIEAINNSKENILNVITDTNHLVSEISWTNNQEIYRREYYYFNDLGDIDKTIDFKNDKIILETNYNIDLKENIFFDFIISNEISDLSLITYGNYSITSYNEFLKPIKTTYYSINNHIVGSIVKNFEQEHLSLINEIWYIGDYDKKIREFQISFDPETNKNKWIENRYR